MLTTDHYRIATNAWLVMDRQQAEAYAAVIGEDADVWTDPEDGATFLILTGDAGAEFHCCMIAYHDFVYEPLADEAAELIYSLAKHNFDGELPGWETYSALVIGACPCCAERMAALANGEVEILDETRRFPRWAVELTGDAAEFLYALHEAHSDRGPEEFRWGWVEDVAQRLDPDLTALIAAPFYRVEAAS